MAVRRLHPDQPSEPFKFTRENEVWAEAQIAKYPKEKQAAAVIPLMWRAQEQNGGWLTEPAMRAVADKLRIAHIRAYEIATFYTMFQLAPVGRKAHVQVCGTTPCMLRGSTELIDVCRERIAPHAHELSANGDFSWEEVECLGSCANAPLVQIGNDTYEDLDAERLHRVLDGFAKGRPVKPGSQTGRQASCPKGGPTTLKLAQSPGAAPGGAAVVREAPAAAPVRLAEMTPTAGDRTGRGHYAMGVVLGSESAGDDEPPGLLSKPRGGKADDLKLISGIGPLLEKALAKLGVYHFDQIANWTKLNIKWVDQNLEDFRGRAERDKWVEQAKKLASGWRPDKNSGEKPKG